MVAVAVLVALLPDQLETRVEVLFLVVVEAAVVVEFLLPISQHNALAVQVVELKGTPLVVVEPLALLVEQVVLAHSHPTVLALAVVVALLHTFLPLVLEVLEVQVAVAAVEVARQQMASIQVLVALVVLA